MKRIFAVLTVISAIVMLNGCSKCSQERPAEPPAVVEPPANPPPADETAPPPTTDPATPPPAEGTTPPAGEVK